MDILIDLIVTDLPIILQDRIKKTKVASMEGFANRVAEIRGFSTKKENIFLHKCF